MIRKASLLLFVVLFAASCASTSTDPNDPNAKAKRGAGVGAAAGAIVGAIIGNQSGGNRTGAVVGAAAGAAIGAAIGVMTAQPLPAYKQIAVPQEAVIPGFYDTWPPGSHSPPIAAQTPPPKPG